MLARETGAVIVAVAMAGRRAVEDLRLCWSGTLPPPADFAFHMGRALAATQLTRRRAQDSAQLELCMQFSIHITSILSKHHHHTPPTHLLKHTNPSSTSYRHLDTLSPFLGNACRAAVTPANSTCFGKRHFLRPITQLWLISAAVVLSIARMSYAAFVWRAPGMPTAIINDCTPLPPPRRWSCVTFVAGLTFGDMLRL